MQAIQAKYKFGLVLLGLALLNETNKQQKSDEQDEADNIFTTIEKVSQAVSPIIIPMIDTLGALELKTLFLQCPKKFRGDTEAHAGNIGIANSGAGHWSNQQR